MGRTERRVLVAASIAFLLALTAATVAATPAAPGEASPAASPASASAVAFAEWVTARERPTGGREAGSWQNAIELIALAGTCAIAVAFYSAATAPRTDSPEPVRVRRR